MISGTCQYGQHGQKPLTLQCIDHKVYLRPDHLVGDHFEVLQLMLDVGRILLYPVSVIYKGI